MNEATQEEKEMTTLLEEVGHTHLQAGITSFLAPQSS